MKNLARSGISKMEGGNLHSKETRFLARYHISRYSADNNGNLTFSTPDEETDPIPTGFVKSYPKQESVGCTKQTEDASSITMHVIVHLTLVIQYCQNYARGDELLPGHIIVKSGPVYFQIKLNDGRIMKRHQDQIRHSHYSNEHTKDHTKFNYNNSYGNRSYT